MELIIMNSMSWTLTLFFFSKDYSLSQYHLIIRRPFVNDKKCHLCHDILNSPIYIGFFLLHL